MNHHAVRRWINRLAELIMLARGEYADQGERDSFLRVNHECVCVDCGEPFWRHASDPYERWLTVICDGSRVKL